MAKPGHIQELGLGNVLALSVSLWALPLSRDDLVCSPFLEHFTVIVINTHFVLALPCPEKPFLLSSPSKSSEPSSIPTSAETLPGGSVPFLHPPPQTPLKFLVSWRSLSRLSSFLVSVTPSHRHVLFPQTNCRLPSEGEGCNLYNF